MPVIARFDGVTIRMFYNDHPPPHIHIDYGGDRAIMTLGGTVLAGTLPAPIVRRVAIWIESNADAVALTWQRARSAEPLGEV